MSVSEPSFLSAKADYDTETLQKYKKYFNSYLISSKYSSLSTNISTANYSGIRVFLVIL